MRAVASTITIPPPGQCDPREQGDELADREGHPLVEWVASAVPLVDDNTSQGVVVIAFVCDLARPARQVESRCVLAFDSYALPVQAHAADVALVAASGLDAAVDPVVDVRSEAVGDLTFEARPSSVRR
ncbi:hypothetical protein [Gordonia liuliyuniae]|uniref:hypothetical protein n=1 Tax=Gordonia liuliyuniae TaxID=2911517 RepID=UPI0027E1B76C|nr:hypothetical protein [Gordonia liuliyuniae]